MITVKVMTYVWCFVEAKFALSLLRPERERAKSRWRRNEDTGYNIAKEQSFFKEGTIAPSPSQRRYRIDGTKER